MDVPVLVADPDAGQREFVRRVLGQGGFRTAALGGRRCRDRPGRDVHSRG